MAMNSFGHFGRVNGTPLTFDKLLENSKDVEDDGMLTIPTQPRPCKKL
jgi:hypothetical protein